MKKLTTMSKFIFLTAITISSAAVSATEVENHMNHDMHQTETRDVTIYDKNSGQTHQSHLKAGNEVQSEYATAYIKANTDMHKGMLVQDTGNADVYFVKSMLAHHIGAVDMAKIQLQYGKDEKMIQLAKSIIAAQELEIKEMQDWLKQNDK